MIKLYHLSIILFISFYLNCKYILEAIYLKCSLAKTLLNFYNLLEYMEISFITQREMSN